MIYISKYIILILAIMVVRVRFVSSNIDSYSVCMEKLSVGGFNDKQTGYDAFEHAYYNLTLHFTSTKERNKLNIFFRLIFKVSTQGYKSLLEIKNPEEWCKKNYKNEYLVCKRDLKAGGFKRTDMTSLEALRHAFNHLTTQLLKKKNDKTTEYYIYLFHKYSPYIVHRNITSPSEYCTDNDYGRLNVVKDNEGNPIDLNNCYEDYEDNNNDGYDDQYKSQIQSTVMVMYSNTAPYDDCMKELAQGDFNDQQTGQAAFIHAYQNLTLGFAATKGSVLHKYFHHIYVEATLGYKKLTFIQSPNEWCKKNFSDDFSICKQELIEGNFKRKNMTSIQALRHAFYYLTNIKLEKKNDKTKQYYNYLLNEYLPILYNKIIKYPVEYCSVQCDKRLNTTEDIHCYHTDYNIQYENNATDENEDEYEDQDHALFNAAGEGSSNLYNMNK